MGKKDPDENEYETLRSNWLKEVRSDTSYASPSAFESKEWTPMTLPTPNGWEEAGLEGVDGAIWFRNTFTLPDNFTGKDLYIDLGRIRDLDYTYINGHLIGTSEGISTKRHYLIPKDILLPGKNRITVQVINFDDKGGFTGLKGDKPPFIIYPEGTPPGQALHLPTIWGYNIQDFNPPPMPKYEAEYQPFADLFLHFTQQNPENYRRELNLSTAIAKTTYTDNGIQYTREYLSGNRDKAIVIHLAADKPGSISFTTGISSLFPQHIYRVDAHTLQLDQVAK